MRKKYLSALLFGALLVTSAGTFTSCKDYDDEINNLQTQITDLQTSVKSLEELVKAGKYVTAVEKTAEGIKFTFNQGDPVIIALEEAGQEGQVFELRDGEIYVDNEPTGIKPAKDPEKAPVKVENGVWMFLNEEGEYESTDIPVSGVNVSGSEEDGFVLEIIDANGNSQKVEVPTANSLVSSITFATIPSNKDLYDATKLVTSANDFYTLDGTKYTKGSLISALNPDGTKGFKVNVVVTPSNIDPADLKFSMVNSEGKTIFNDAVVSTPTGAIQAGSRAVDGVYELAFTIKDGVKAEDLTGDKIIADGDGLAVVCGKATTNFVYVFDDKNSITTTTNLTVTSDEKYVKLGEEYSIFGKAYTNDPTITPNANKDVAFLNEFKSVSSVKLDIDENIAELYGITFNDDHTAFTISNEKALEKEIKFNVYYTGASTDQKDAKSETTLTVKVAKAAIVTEMSTSATHVLSTDADKKMVFFPLENIVSGITSPSEKYIWNSGTITEFKVVNDNTPNSGSFALTSENKHGDNKLTIEYNNEITWTNAADLLFKANKTDKAANLGEAAYIGMSINPEKEDVTADTYTGLIQIVVSGTSVDGVQTTLTKSVNFSLTLTNPATKFTRIPLYFDGDNLTAYGEVNGDKLEFDVTSAYNDGTDAPSFTVVNKEDKDGWTVINSNKTIQIPLDKLYTTTQKFEVSYLMFENATNNKVTETVYVTGQSPIKDGEVTVSKTELSLATGSDTFTAKDIKGVDVFNKEYVLFATANAGSSTTAPSITGSVDERIISTSLEVTDANKGAFEILKIYSWIYNGKLYQGLVNDNNMIVDYISNPDNAGELVSIVGVEGAQLTGFSVKLKESTGVANGAKVPFKLTITDKWNQKVEKEISLTVEK